MHKMYTTKEEKNDEVNRRMRRAASSIYHACLTSYRDNQCGGCPFKVSMGCNLYGHPIEWKHLLQEIKVLH